MSKKIVLDEKLRECLQKAIDNAGSVYVFSQKIDVAHTTVRDWMNGTAKSMRNDILIRVLREIKQFLTVEEYDHYMNLYGEGIIISKHTPSAADPATFPLLDLIIAEVMASDLDAESKVKVFNIITRHKKK